MNSESPKEATATPINHLEDGGGDATKKPHVRTGDKSNEEFVIPKNRLVLVFIALMLTVFLAALDQTIICTFPVTPKHDPTMPYRKKTNSRLFSNRTSYHSTGFKWRSKLCLDRN